MDWKEFLEKGSIAVLVTASALYLSGMEYYLSLFHGLGTGVFFVVPMDYAAYERYCCTERCCCCRSLLCDVRVFLSVEPTTLARCIGHHPGNCCVGNAPPRRTFGYSASYYATCGA